MERGRGGGAGGFGTCEVEIYHYGVLTASNHHSFARFVGESVYLLVRHEWRNIDEVTRPGFTAEFEVVSPAHASPAANDVEDGFELAVVMRPDFALGSTTTVPAHNLLAPVRACVIAAARVMPGVWGVLGSSSLAGTILTP
jgi:hypothetical protein